MSDRERRAVAALLFANVLWGVSIVAARDALDELNAPLVAFMRVAPGVPCMLAVMAWRRQSFRLSFRDAWAYGLLGLFGFAGAKYLQYAGLAKSTAVHGSLLVSFEAILTMLAACVFLSERLTWRKTLSAAAGFAGVCVVSRIKPWEGLAALADQQALGNLIMVASLGCEAAYTVWGARLVRRHDPYRAMTWSLAFGALMLLPTLPPGSGRELLDASASTWVSVLFLGIGPTAVAYTIWLAAARHLDAGNMAITLYVQPLTGTLAAVALLGEGMRWTTIAGGVLLLGAVRFASRGSQTRAAPAAVAPGAVTG